MTDSEGGKRWGISPAISEAHPSEADLKLNEQLLDALKKEDNFETPEGQERREKVILHLRKVTVEFVKRVGKLKGLAQSTIDTAGGTVCTFGSYALGAYNPKSDIDTLVVAPKHVSSDDYFKVFPVVFKEMCTPDEIGEFVPVPSAYVPLIKMKFRGISIDALFCSIPSTSAIKPGEFDLKDRKYLRGLNDQQMKSVNGTRVCEELLAAVPHKAPFRHALRAVKLWSERRGIYGNVFGYPGGVAWAIMVARICQLYPFACGGTVLCKFFPLMIKWPWPRPVLLKNLDEESMSLKVWNPMIYTGDRAHLMPVITPAFPGMCSTHTITHSTRTTMIDEFKRAEAICHSVMSGKKSWSALWEHSSFFTKDHKYYLSIIATCRTKESHDSFSGLVQSRVRSIAKGIDDGAVGVEVARPYPNEFARVHRCQTEDQIDQICQGNTSFQITDKEFAELTSSGDKEEHIIYTSTWYIGLTLPEGETKSLDISYPVSHFKNFITSHDDYNANLMSVKVVHTRNHQLPDDVFEPGETRPVKPPKKKKTKNGKRDFAETGLQDSEHAPAKRREADAHGMPTPTTA